MRLKPAVYSLLISFACITGCSKDEQVPAPLPQTTQNLTGMGNRVWKIQEIDINGIPQTLTLAQKGYTKTYTVEAGKTTNGKVVSSDGYSGDWSFPSEKILQENYNNDAQFQGIQVLYTINELTATKLDVSYTKNGQLTREVYIAF